MEAARLDSHTQETLSAPAVEAALGLAERPEALLDKREELGEECQRAVKVLFDLAKRLEPKRFTPLPELLVEGFTLDQIWEQLALYNAPLLKYSQRRLRSHLAQPQDVDLPVPADSEEDEEDEQAGAAAGSDSDDDPYSGFRSDGDEAESSDESDPEAAASKARRRLRRQDGAAAAAVGGADGSKGPRRERKKRHAMENSFFSFDDMEKFMDEAEEEYMNEYNKDDDGEEEEGKDGMGWSYEEGDADDSVPYQDVEEGWEGSEEEEEEEDGAGPEMKYGDFFDPPDELVSEAGKAGGDVEIGFNPEFAGSPGEDADMGEEDAEPDNREDDEEDDVEEEDEEGRAEFIPAQSFSGAKAGYVFKNGGQGTGYYREEQEEDDEEEDEEEDDDGAEGFDSLMGPEDAELGDGGGASGGGGDEGEELDGELGPRSAFGTPATPTLSSPRSCRNWLLNSDDVALGSQSGSSRSC